MFWRLLLANSEFEKSIKHLRAYCDKFSTTECANDKDHKHQSQLLQAHRAHCMWLALGLLAKPRVGIERFKMLSN